MKKLLLLFVVAFSTIMSAWTQTGSDCSNPITAKIGINQYSSSKNDSLFFRYIVTLDDALITAYSFGHTNATTNMSVTIGCDSTVYSWSPNYTKNQSYGSLRAKKGDTIIFKWTGDTIFNWNLTEDAYMDPKGTSPGNPFNAFEGPNSFDFWHFAGVGWFSYVFPEDGSITVSNCQYNNGGEIFVFKGLPKYFNNFSNRYYAYYDNKVYTEPNLLSFGNYNCDNLNYGAEVKVNGKKGDEILINTYNMSMAEMAKGNSMMHNMGNSSINQRFDISFSKAVLPAGNDKGTPYSITTGLKEYNLFNKSDERSFAYFSYTPAKNSYYILKANGQDGWQIADKDTATEYYGNRGHVFKAFAGQEYTFALRVFNNMTDAVKVNLSLTEFTDTVVVPCSNVKPFLLGEIVVSDFSYNNQLVYSFTALEEGDLYFKNIAGNADYIQVYSDCSVADSTHIGEAYWGSNYFVSKGQTIYLKLISNLASTFTWTTYFKSTTDFLSFNTSDQLGNTQIDKNLAQVNIEVNYNVDLNSELYSSYSIFYGDSLYLLPDTTTSINLSYAYFIYNNPLKFLIKSASGATKEWTVNVTQAAVPYSGTNIDSITISNQLAPPVALNDSVFTVNVRWSGYGDYSTYTVLSKGATTYDSYFYFNNQDQTDTTFQINVTAQDGSSKMYYLKVHRNIPAGAFCSTPVTLNLGENTDPTWVNTTYFKFTSDKKQLVKLSGFSESGYIYVYTDCNAPDTYYYTGFYSGSVAAFTVEAGSYILKTEAYSNPIQLINFELAPLPSGNSIISASVANNSNVTISEASRTVTAILPYGTIVNDSSMNVYFNMSQGAKAYYDGQAWTSGYLYHNFNTTNPLEIPIVAMNGDSVIWKIYAQEETPLSEKNIISFVLNQQIAPAKIGVNTIDVLVRPEADLSALIPVFELSNGAFAYIGEEYQYSKENLVNFTKPVIYKVGAQDGTSLNWTINVHKASYSDANILNFNLHGQLMPGNVDAAAKTVNVEVMDAFDIKALATYAYLSPGATASVNGVNVNYGSEIDYSALPVQLKVTSADKSLPVIWKLYVKQLVAGDCNALFDYKVDVNGVIFNNTSVGSNLASSWDFGDGTTSTLWYPMHKYKSTGDYKVTLTVVNSLTQCSSSISKTITVDVVNPVVADFGFESSQASLDASFTNASIGADSYLWNFGDGGYSTDASPTYTYEYPGYYSVCLQANNTATGAGATVCKELTVGDVSCDADAWFGYTVNEMTVAFGDSSIGTYDTRYWNFGDGKTSSDVNPSNTYSKPGYYEVSLSIKKSGSTCFDNYDTYILVGTAECKASFTANADQVLKTVKFNNTSTGNLSHYFWDFGDGTYSEEANPQKTYENNGVFSVSLTVSDESGSCMDYTYQEINLGNVNCNASYTYFADASSKTIYLNSADNDAATQYLWVLGDGTMSTAKNPVHQFKFGGYYTVALTVFNLQNACMDSYEDMVQIGDAGVDCEANFAYMPSGLNVSFTDKSKGDIALYVWNFGDGSYDLTASPAPHTYNAGGYYNVCLTVVNSAFMVNTTCNEIGVALDEFNNCRADFSFVIDSVSRKASFTDESVGKPNTWEWDFGDENTDNFANPIHKYSEKGYYIAALTITNEAGCNDTQYKLVNAGEEQTGLVARFIAKEDTSNKKAGGYPVDFTGAGLGDEARLKWDFGDGQTDTTSTTPSHAYDENGTYKVCYTISDPITGDSSQYCQDVVYTGATKVISVGIDKRINAYPIPLAENVHIQFYLSGNKAASVEILDPMGRRVALVANKQFSQGVNSLNYNVSALKRGAYILRLISKGEAPAAIMITK